MFKEMTYTAVADNGLAALNILGLISLIANVNNRQEFEDGILPLLLAWPPIPGTVVKIEQLGVQPTLGDELSSKPTILVSYQPYKLEGAASGSFVEPVKRIGRHQILGVYDPRAGRNLIYIQLNERATEDYSTYGHGYMTASPNPIARWSHQVNQARNTPLSIANELMQMGANKATADAVVVVLTQLGFDDRTVPDVQVTKDELGVLFTYGLCYRFVCATKRSLNLDGQQLQWLMDHSGGIAFIHIDKKKPN